MRKCLFLLSVLFFAFFIIGCGTESQVIIKPEFTGRHVEVIREVSEESEAEPEVWFCPRDNCSSHLAGFINNAEESVHCAVFDLDLADVIDALQSKQKSIDVKVVVDNDNSKILEDLSFIRFDDKNQLSHNKFCVIDGKIVWTGSFNPTERCNFKNNNNAVVYESR